MAARWHTRQLVGLLAGLRFQRQAERLEAEGESPAQTAKRRVLRARRIALGLLVRLADIQKVFTALKRVNRRLLLLTAALLRARTGEAVVDAPYAGPVRLAAVTALEPEKIGNAYARRETEEADEKARLPHFPDEDEPGPAGSGRAPYVTEWEALLVAALGPGEGQEALGRLADVLWAQVRQLAAGGSRGGYEATRGAAEGQASGRGGAAAGAGPGRGGSDARRRRHARGGGTSAETGGGSAGPGFGAEIRHEGRVGVDEARASRGTTGGGRGGRGSRNWNWMKVGRMGFEGAPHRTVRAAKKMPRSFTLFRMTAWEG